MSVILVLSNWQFVTPFAGTESNFTRFDDESVFEDVRKYRSFKRSESLKLNNLYFKL